MSIVPLNVSPEQWTPEYAAQILQIMQQSQSLSPDVPGLGQPSIVPMGAPGSLTPPPLQTKAIEGPVQAAPMPQQMPQQAPQMAPMMAPAMAQDQSSQGAPTPTPTPGAISSLGGSEGGFMDKVRPFLPMMAAMIASGHPRTRGMAPIMMQLGQVIQQQAGQKQLAEIRSNIATIGQTKGADAVKKYLTEAVSNPNLSPNISKIVADQLEQVTTRTQERDAVAKLTSRNPQDIMSEMPKLVESMGAEKAMALFKGLKLEDRGQFLQAGEQIFWADRATQEVKEVARATPKFNAASIGGTDVTQELMRMGIEDAAKATPEQVQQATQNILDREEANKAKSRSTRLTEAEILARGTVQAQVEGMKMAEKQKNETLPKEAAQQLADMKTSHALLKDIERAYDPKYTGPVAGPWGKVKSYAGWASQEEVTQRQRVIAAMNARLRTDSGLAVTPNELERKLQELPQVNDPPETFMPKLKEVSKWVERSYRDRHQFYTDPRKALPPQLSDETASKTPVEVPTATPQGGEWKQEGKIRWRIRK